jgi:NTP pyrophosphatase (non-canonical NTP hydrolase)
MADVLAHVLLLARHCGVDLQTAVEEKWFVYNPEWADRSSPGQSKKISQSKK